MYTILESNTSSLLMTIGPLVLLFLVIYFMIMRPEKKRRQQLLDMQSQLQRNSKIVTIGGIYGIVDEVNDDSVTLIIASGAKMKVDKGAIKRILNPEE